MAELISIDEARGRVLEAVRPLGTEEVALDAAFGRVLAEDVTSAIPVPPFDSSAMDGYAVAAGPAAELEVVGESRAGHPAAVAVRGGTAVRISTGAAVPEGADAVVPIERSEPVLSGDAPQDGLVRVPAIAAGENVRYAGEDVRAGDVVLHTGTVLGPAELGVAASVGRPALRCVVRPRVALLVTGDELTEPGEGLRPGGIYSSNRFALAAQIERARARLVLHESVPDDATGTRAALTRALDAADVVIVSGGVSVGPHDHVKAALRELGIEERFWGVRLRPGKPVWFGVGERALVYGLPGNPVSAMVTFQLFVRSALAALQGADPSAARGEAVLDEAVPRNPRREEALRVRLRPDRDGWHATTTGEQGSHMLTSMLRADALAFVAAGSGEVAAGERVEIELL
ncbi:MAG TPA: gephyrin-like molybdotransferase Glp [Thermoleophilaceae bacterium]